VRAGRGHDRRVEGEGEDSRWKKGRERSERERLRWTEAEVEATSRGGRFGRDFSERKHDSNWAKCRLKRKECWGCDSLCNED
jgi:hypothetical protein